MNAIDSCPLEMLGMNFEWIGMGISTINNLDIKAIAGRTYLHDPSWSINAGQRWTRRDRPDATVPVAKIWRDDDLASFTDLTSSWYGTMVKVCLASVRIVRQELGLCMGWQLQYLVIYWDLLGQSGFEAFMLRSDSSQPLMTFPIPTLLQSSQHNQQCFKKETHSVHMPHTTGFVKRHQLQLSIIFLAWNSKGCRRSLEESNFLSDSKSSSQPAGEAWRSQWNEFSQRKRFVLKCLETTCNEHQRLSTCQETDSLCHLLPGPV